MWELHIVCTRSAMSRLYQDFTKKKFSIQYTPGWLCFVLCFLVLLQWKKMENIYRSDIQVTIEINSHWDAYMSFIWTKTIFTKYCLSGFTVPWEFWNPPREAIPIKFYRFGGHNKCNCLQAWGNFRRWWAWQIISIFNTILVPADLIHVVSFKFAAPALGQTCPSHPKECGWINYLNNYKWFNSWSCSCPVTWFCYQLIAKPGNKMAALLWPDPYIWQN